MIGVLVAAATLPALVFQPGPGLGTVTLCAVVAPGVMNAREAAAWRLAVECLADGTEDFGPADLARYGGQTGVPPRWFAGAGSLRVELTVPKSGLDVGVSLLRSMLLAPKFDGLAEARVRLARTVDPWRRALEPFDLPLARVQPRDVREAWSRWIQPGSVAVGVWGDFEAEDVRAALAEAWEWPARPPHPIPDAPLEPSPAQAPGQASLELRGPAGLDARGFLAVVALGVGKHGALHRIARERLGWSYRQEAVLWASPAGWTPRLVALTVPGVGSCAELRQALLADVEGWSETEVRRAVALGRAVLEGAVALDPFWLDASGPMGRGGLARLREATLRALWPKLTDPATWKGELESVSLEDLRATARALVTHALPLTLGGGDWSGRRGSATSLVEVRHSDREGDSELRPRRKTWIEAEVAVRGY